jgi:putative endonuclease
LVDRNWRGTSARGEIDLVVRRGRILVFSEVKTRAGDRYGEPFEAVTRAKQVRIRRLAAEWLRRRGSAVNVRADEIRFDVVSIKGATIDVLEGAF